MPQCDLIASYILVLSVSDKWTERRVTVLGLDDWPDAGVAEVLVAVAAGSYS